MSTLNVTIPDSILRRAEALAKEDDVSIDQFIATAVAEKIASAGYRHLHRKEGRSSQPREV